MKEKRKRKMKEGKMKILHDVAPFFFFFFCFLFFVFSSFLTNRPVAKSRKQKIKVETGSTIR